MSGNKSKEKGQIFTLDILAALIGITLLLGVTLQYQTEIKNTQSGQLNKEMRTMAADAAQIAVKNTLVKNGKANTVDSTKQGDLQTLMNQLVPDQYDYEVKMDSGAVNINTGACAGKERVANSRRIVQNDAGNLDTLTVVICR